MARLTGNEKATRALKEILGLDLPPKGLAEMSEHHAGGK